MKNIDEYGELTDDIVKILDTMIPISSNKVKFDNKVIYENIKKLNMISHEVLDIKDITNFQELLRIQNSLINNNIRLVGIDISRTIVEYQATFETKIKAAKKIKSKYKKIFDNYTSEEIVKIFNEGFYKYSKYRTRIKKDLDEVFVYKKYILKKFIKNSNTDDTVINDIIKIWMENSVKLKLNSKKIIEIINELKKRNIIVVSISDMLGEMSKYALKYFDLYNLFDAHFCSNDFKHRKANKKTSLYNYVTSYYKLNPNNCLMIGNDIIDDVKSSIYNRWYSIFVSYGNKDIQIKNKIATITKLDDLLNLLLDDKIKELPLLKYSVKTLNEEAIRDNDSNAYIKNAYYIRQNAKRFANRNLREYIYKNYLIQYCGSTTRLGNNIEIRNPFRMFIGDNCQINDNFTVLNENYVFIGDNVMIANNVFISTYEHSWKKGMLQDNIESWKKGDTKTNCVSIENNCWIGPNCSFESNVYLGHHSVVCANTLVKSGIYPPYSLIGGAPCKVIKNIKNELDIESKVIPFE